MVDLTQGRDHGRWTMLEMTICPTAAFSEQSRKGFPFSGPVSGLRSGITLDRICTASIGMPASALWVKWG